MGTISNAKKFAIAGGATAVAIGYRSKIIDVYRFNHPNSTKTNNQILNDMMDSTKLSKEFESYKQRTKKK
ncbi:hypothetical protein FACS189490_13950 [Clostridia bacterium]|nr:hypothetical protein FACS189490_13950 [Clostridia bacterium]